MYKFKNLEKQYILHFYILTYYFINNKINLISNHYIINPKKKKKNKNIRIYITYFFFGLKCSLIIDKYLLKYLENKLQVSADKCS